jgi:hypothetical protein
MPRFANAEKTRKRTSDLIKKLQSMLTTSITFHNKLQQENRQLQQEFQLLKAFCDGLGAPPAWQTPHSRMHSSLSFHCQPLQCNNALKQANACLLCPSRLGRSVVHSASSPLY